MKYLRAAERFLVVVIVALVLPSTLAAQAPAPSDVFGFEPGDDYKLASYDQLLEYYRQLDAASPRVVLQEIGNTVLGRPLLLLLISSEANLAQLDRWQQISTDLATARIDEETARQYAREGKAVVWIEGGLHATEVAPSQMLPNLAHHMATDESEETRRIRDNVILLLMPSMNPDGLEVVRNWYQRNLKTPFETTRPPELYHHYVGHDNNRDWFMNNMPETAAVSKVLYQQWFPQIVYNHHQSGPSWARIFLPPFSDPVNPNIHPGVTTGVNLVGSAMSNRFAMKQMPGAVSDMTFSMWWNGGMRTVPYFHNMIGILTETSHATASPRYYDPEERPEQVGNPRRGQSAPTSGEDIFYPYPWPGGDSRFSDPVRYTFTASMAVLDIAANLKARWLYGIYSMGRDAIAAADENRFAYVIPAQQWDPQEARNLVEILMRGGVEIESASEYFSAGEHNFEAGSHIIYGNQAFRNYAIDLLEKQSYPDRRRTPDGPPDPPYDLAGWTLPMQMGVEVMRIDEAFSASSQALSGFPDIEPGSVSGDPGFGFAFSSQTNANVHALNRLTRAGERVFRSEQGFTAGSTDFPAGSYIVENRGQNTVYRVNAAAATLGLDFVGLSSRSNVALTLQEPVRVGLYKSWVANMDEGWTRWLLENYEFEFETLLDRDVRETDLSRFDAILLPSQDAASLLNGHTPGTMPDEYVGGLGLAGALALKQFVEAGGTLVTLDAASDFAIKQFGLPVENTVADTTDRQFFIPGSLIRAKVDTSHPLAAGTQEELATSFVNSRAFEVVTIPRTQEGGEEQTPEPPEQPVETIVSYAKEDILMSGWALGEEEYIAEKAAMMKVRLGEGSVILFGFRPQFRGQPRATYKLLFNSLLQ